MWKGWGRGEEEEGGGLGDATAAAMCAVHAAMRGRRSMGSGPALAGWSGDGDGGRSGRGGVGCVRALCQRAAGARWQSASASAGAGGMEGERAAVSESTGRRRRKTRRARRSPACLCACACVRACVRAFSVTAARRRGPERQVRTVCAHLARTRDARVRGASSAVEEAWIPIWPPPLGQSLGAPALGGTTELTWTRRRRWCPESTGRIRKRARIGEAKSEMPAAIGWPLRSTNSNHSVAGYIPLPSSDLPRPRPLPRPRAPPLAVALLAPTHVHSTLSIYITHSSIYPPERAQQPAGAAPLRVSPPSCRRTHHRTCPNPPPTCQSPVPALAHSPNDARPSPRPPIDHAHAHPSRQTPCLAPILHYIPPRPSAEPALY